MWFLALVSNAHNRVSWSQPLRGGTDNLPPKERMWPTTQEPPQRLGPQVRPGRCFANYFIKSGRRPSGCHLPSTTTSRRCRDQPRSEMLRLRPELPSVQHTLRLPHARLRDKNPLANPMQWCAPLSTVSTLALPYPQRARATSYHSSPHACCSCHHPFRPGTRSLAGLAQGCMSLAHAARCIRSTAPPNQWRYLHHRNVTETVAGVSASALIPRDHPRNLNRIIGGGCNRTIAANTRPFV